MTLKACPMDSRTRVGVVLCAGIGGMTREQQPQTI